MSATIAAGAVGAAVVGGLGVGGAYVGVLRAGGGPPRGLAPGFDVHRTMSDTAVRRSALHTRPGLHVTSRTPVRDCGTHLARVGRRSVYASLEDVTLVSAGPRRGKTGGLMAPAVVDSPGAVMFTSTKIDGYRLTAPHRRGPQLVFNPEGVGGLGSTLRWDPVRGCEDPEQAAARAGYLLAAGASRDVSDHSFWEGTAHTYLRCLLMAAALEGTSMRTVAQWARNFGDSAPRRILDRDDEAPNGWADQLRQLQEAPERTRDSISLTLSKSLAFMGVPALVEAVCPASGESSFDVELFIDSGATLYMIGRDRDHGAVAPLFGALAGHLVDSGRRIAQARGGRLDPPMLLALDEAAHVCRVPIERWTADAGGHGIPMLIAVQGLDQLEDVWGAAAAATVWENAATKVLFGGVSVARRLEDLVTIVGERVERRNGSLEWGPVLRPEDIFTLPFGRVLILRGGVGAMLGTAQMVWDRKDLRQPWREAESRREPTGPLAPIIRLADRRRRQPRRRAS